MLHPLKGSITFKQTLQQKCVARASYLLDTYIITYYLLHVMLILHHITGCKIRVVFRT